jgi:hypothetical protein
MSGESGTKMIRTGKEERRLIQLLMLRLVPRVTRTEKKTRMKSG